jgi:hypothetical protein
VHLRSDRHRLAKVVLRKLTRCHRDPVGMLCVEEDTSGIHIHTYTHTHTQTYTHARTHTHTHTHTQVLASSAEGNAMLLQQTQVSNVFSTGCVLCRMCSL